MLNPKVVGIVEVTETLTTLEDESGLQLRDQKKNLAIVLKLEVTADRKKWAEFHRALCMYNNNLFAVVSFLFLIGPHILLTVVRRSEILFHSLSTGL